MKLLTNNTTYRHRCVPPVMGWECHDLVADRLGYYLYLGLGTSGEPVITWLLKRTTGGPRRSAEDRLRLK